MAAAGGHVKMVQPSVTVVGTMWVAQGEVRIKIGLYFDRWSAIPSILAYY